MGWSSIQQKRLQTERKILNKYFPRFRWISPADSDNAKIEGELRTNSKIGYTVRVYIPSDFPNSCPDMVVVSPYSLTGYGGENLKTTSGSMHTLSSRDGYVRICHYRDWIPNLTLYLVLLKGRLWIEALECHKRTGRPIDDFLPHMQ